MNIPATFEQRISNKTGKPYNCIVIQLTPKTEKLVFLDNAESELAELTYANQKIKPNPNN